MEYIKLFFQNPQMYELALGMGILVVITIAICIFFFSKSISDLEDYRIGISFLGAAVAVCFLWLILCKENVAMVTENELKQEQLNNAIEMDYDIFVNGSKVEAENINIHAYSNVTIDYENQTILITVD